MEIRVSGLVRATSLAAHAASAPQRAMDSVFARFGADWPPVPVDSGGRGHGSDAELQPCDVAARGCSPAEASGLCLLSPRVAAAHQRQTIAKGPYVVLSGACHAAACAARLGALAIRDARIFHLGGHVPTRGSRRPALTRVWPPRRKAIVVDQLARLMRCLQQHVQPAGWLRLHCFATPTYTTPARTTRARASPGASSWSTGA